MKVGSMFAGIGGFDLGFERAGFEVAWCIEKDRSAQKLLRVRFPHAKIYGDIEAVDPSELERVDVICGGFPCQDLSKAGRREGLKGDRSGLFFEAMRIVRAIGPRVLVLENVPGMLTSNRGHDFAAVLREVGEGWGCEEVAWRILDSQFFGVAQRRKRCFVVASSEVGCSEEILALPESLCGDNCEGRAEGQEASAADGCSVAGAVSSKWSKGTGGPSGDECYNLTINLSFRKTKRAQTATDSEHWITDDVANTLNGFDIGEARATQLICEASTVVRRLTPEECEMLQGFPVGWTSIGTEAKPTKDTRRYMQLGNAVTVNVAEWIARRAMKALKE
jgi:DNA (cytosine-5)-methyltransferase 1